MVIFNTISRNPYFLDVAAYVICFFLSFWAHDVFTFRDIEEKKRCRIIQYVIVYTIYFLVNYFVLTLELNFTAWLAEVIFVLKSAVFALTSYGLCKTFVFSKGKNVQVD
jgi:putative flippase GtrA